MKLITTAEKEIKYSWQDVVSVGLQQDFSIALWRLPHQTKINLLLASDAKWVNELTIEELSPGFVFAPFDPNKSKCYLEAEHIFTFTDQEIIETTGKGFLQNISDLIHDRKSEIKFNGGTSSPDNSNKAESYLDLVKLSINAIEAGAFEKVVPSRQAIIDLNTDFDLLNSFEMLCERYPLAMVSLVSSPKLGTWMGATPELLVSTDKHGIFRTVALAGTQPYLEQMPLKNVSWTQKEIEEQALVERYIISCFKKIRVREYEEHGPKTVQAGNLIHLRSDFEVNMKEVGYPQLGSVMLKLLHPTSAVCGMPLESSYKFLQENESYDREFYSGFLGPINVDNESHVFVNLRCMKWCGDKMVLYAGAGVTIDSIPEQEKKEVDMKFDTILNALNLK